MDDFDKLVELVAERVSAKLVDLVAAKVSVPTPSSPPITAHLSPREKQILNLLGKGMSNKAMATEMNISHGAVKTYMYRLMGKTKKNRLELAIMGYNQPHEETSSNPSGSPVVSTDSLYSDRV